MLILLTSGVLAFSQGNFFLLPQSLLSYKNGQATINYENKTLQFDLAKGWQSEIPLLGNFQDHIYIDGNNVYLSQNALDYLGLNLPKLRNVTFNQESNLRLIFEIDKQVHLNRYIQTGELNTNEALNLGLPPLLIPFGIPLKSDEFILEFIVGLEHTTLNLAASQPMRYRVFSLYNPLRLVIDFTPLIIEESEHFVQQETTPLPYSSPPSSSSILPSLPTLPSLLPSPPSPPSRPPFPTPPFALTRPANEDPYSFTPTLLSRLTERRADLQRGVRYRRFVYPTEENLSTIHLLEIAPYAGEFRVVGKPKVSQTLSELARGGFAAINASYFDPKTSTTIGFLRLDHEIISEPSRNRASIAFDWNQSIIDRVQYQASVYINGKRYPTKAPYEGGLLTLYTRAGETFGNSERGTLVVYNNRVIENTVGPRIVPQEGFVLSYEIGSKLSELTSIKVGDYAQLEVNITPSIFTKLRYAVEAGPLLVFDGKSAYEPSKESFKNTYIVNGRTLQAAIGVKADGTVLLLTANSMTAKELVPLFISLGAERAMRLDSGSSTSLFAAGQVLNRWNERKIVSAIVFFPY